MIARVSAVLLFASALASCDIATEGPLPPQSECARADYPDWETSDYVLPYPVGQTYSVLQGNCGSFSHIQDGPLAFSYDLTMNIGETVVASRAGEVVFVEAQYEDGDNERGHENGVVVQHADGSTAYYVHFTQDGALVDVGESVAQGQPLGLSGNTGFSTEPHLHFAVYDAYCGATDCTPLPVTFRNTVPNPFGLQQFRTYTALAY